MNKRWRFGDYYSLCRAQRRWIWLPIAAKAPSLSHSMGKTTCCNSQNKPIRSHKTTDSHPFGTQKRLDTSMEWCFIIVISLQSNPYTQTQTPIPITKHVHKQPLKKKREKKMENWEERDLKTTTALPETISLAFCIAIFLRNYENPRFAFFEDENEMECREKQRTTPLYKYAVEDFSHLVKQDEAFV